MMYTLMISYDCGFTYHPELSAHDVDSFRPRMEELDEAMLRYYVEKDGEFCDDVICGIHAGILSFMERARDRERKE